MKKIIGVLSLAVMMLTLSSCEVETSQNGDLDGFWHLEQVDTLATGGTCNFADKRVFWGCQYKLIQVAASRLVEDFICVLSKPPTVC